MSTICGLRFSARPMELLKLRPKKRRGAHQSLLLEYILTTSNSSVGTLVQSLSVYLVYVATWKCVDWNSMSTCACAARKVALGNLWTDAHCLRCKPSTMKPRSVPSQWKDIIGGVTIAVYARNMDVNTNHNIPNADSG